MIDENPKDQIGESLWIARRMVANGLGLWLSGERAKLRAVLAPDAQRDDFVAYILNRYRADANVRAMIDAGAKRAEAACAKPTELRLVADTGSDDAAEGEGR
jgi:hypothetical protein